MEENKEKTIEAKPLGKASNIHLDMIREILGDLEKKSPKELVEIFLKEVYGSAALSISIFNRLLKECVNGKKLEELSKYFINRFSNPDFARSMAILQEILIKMDQVTEKQKNAKPDDAKWVGEK